VEEIDGRSSLGGDRGLRKGDLILELNGMPTTSIDALRKALDSASDGKLKLHIIRTQEVVDLELTVRNLKKP
jgi:S1-C subfamily serine protease